MWFGYFYKDDNIRLTWLWLVDSRVSNLGHTDGQTDIRIYPIFGALLKMLQTSKFIVKQKIYIYKEVFVFINLFNIYF